METTQTEDRDIREDKNNTEVNCIIPQTFFQDTQRLLVRPNGFCIILYITLIVICHGFFKISSYYFCFYI